MTRSLYLALAAVSLVVGIAIAQSTGMTTVAETNTGNTTIAGDATTADDGSTSAAGETPTSEPEPSNTVHTNNTVTDASRESTTEKSGAGTVTISAVMLLLNTALAFLA